MGFRGESRSEGDELAEFGGESVDLRGFGRRREAAVPSVRCFVVFLSSSPSFPSHVSRADDYQNHAGF
jgi:hypothetical protein